MRVETIGNATLYLGDNREIIPDVGIVDLVLTDPPYGIGESAKNHKSRNRIKNGKAIISTDYGKSDWDDEPPEHLDLYQVIASGRKAIIWGNYFGLEPSSKWLVWDKINSGDFADCELAWTNLPGAVRMFRHMWNGMLRDSEKTSPRVHPTQKPIALMSWCIEQAGKPETILDAYMGSGTTGVAAMGLQRKFIGIERDPKYFDVACERIENAQRQERLFA